MNNEHFRSLLKQEVDSSASAPAQAQSTASRAVLGGGRSGHASSNVSKNSAFAQSVRERTALYPPKKFKTTTPRGSRVAAGYIDRAKARVDAAEEEGVGDDKATQIKALEEQLKQQKISQHAFEAARDAITGGDISATHLVKGLDRKLLERVRHGEDVMGGEIYETAEDKDVDDELDKLEEQQVQKAERSTSGKQGLLAESVLAGRKRTRDEIMADLKAQRRKTTVTEPILDHRWRQINDKQKSRVEIDRKGREVLVIVDEDGVVKRMVRKRPALEESQQEEQVIGRNLPGEVLGADIKVPDLPRVPAEEAEQDDSDVDIFEGVGTDYDPLGAAGDNSESDDQDDAAMSRTDHDSELEDRPAQAAPPPAKSVDNLEDISKARNYFNDKPTPTESRQQDHFTSVEAVIAKAAKLASSREGDHKKDVEDEDTALRRAKHAAMLNTRDRDMDDMDLGFGGSRFEDGDDEEAGKGMRLSEWSAADEQGQSTNKGSRRRPGKESRHKS